MNQYVNKLLHQLEVKQFKERRCTNYRTITANPTGRRQLPGDSPRAVAEDTPASTMELAQTCSRSINNGSSLSAHRIKPHTFMSEVQGYASLCKALQPTKNSAAAISASVHARSPGRKP